MDVLFATCFNWFSSSLRFGTLALVLVLQFPIHTKEINKLPKVIEWFFNTPANHRVHHGNNTKYIDKNYGGILMFWDHVFGTYQAEEDETPVKFGLVHPIFSNKAVEIELYEWKNLYSDLRNSRSLKDGLGYIFKPRGGSLSINSTKPNICIGI